MTGFPERRKTLNVLKEAALTRGSYDDFPVAPAGVDPAPHLSRSHVPQPFWLVTELDEVLVTMSGEGEIRFQDAARTVLRLGPGDVVYLPARTPSRIIPDGELLQVRIKGLPPFTEAVLSDSARLASAGSSPSTMAPGQAALMPPSVTRR